MYDKDDIIERLAKLTLAVDELEAMLEKAEKHINDLVSARDNAADNLTVHKQVKHV